jgi:hypothetical protein
MIDNRKKELERLQNEYDNYYSTSKSISSIVRWVFVNKEYLGIHASMNKILIGVLSKDYHTQYDYYMGSVNMNELLAINPRVLKAIFEGCYVRFDSESSC